MDDLARRLANRVQLTSDGHKAYLEAVEGAFGSNIDDAMLVKVYGPAPDDGGVIALPSASARSSIASKAIPIQITFRLATPNGKI